MGDRDQEPCWIWGKREGSHAGHGKGGGSHAEYGGGRRGEGSHAGYWERGEGREHVSPVPAPTCTCILSDKHSLASCKPN